MTTAAIDAPTTAWERDRSARADAFLEFTSGPRIVTQTGLNGVRGMAVIPVVAFHLGYVNIFGGAQLAMSLFFTQSGFLIATLILHEYDRSGGFELGPFWRARARRIFPPAWITLAAVAILRVATRAYDVPNRADLVSALFHVNNWHLYATNAISEAITDGRSSELNHFWSLSVEEQFYVAIALSALLLVAVVRRPLVWLRWLAATGAVVSFALPIAFGWGEERVFYGTDTRAGELLTGVTFATLMISRPVRAALLRWSWTVAAAATVALAAAFVLWHEALPGTGMLENGLLPVGSLLWVLVLLGAMVPDGPVAWLLHRRPLLWLGALSYGIYAFHFPIVRLVHYYTDLHQFASTALAIAATLSVAMLSYRYVERPIRHRDWSSRRLAAGASLVFGAVAVSVVLT